MSHMASIYSHLKQGKYIAIQINIHNVIKTDFRCIHNTIMLKLIVCLLTRKQTQPFGAKKEPFNNIFF